MNINPTQSTEEATPVAAPTSAEYQAPAIENVFTPEAMEREVLYAGVANPSQPPMD